MQSYLGAMSIDLYEVFTLLETRDAVWGLILRDLPNGRSKSMQSTEPRAIPQKKPASVIPSLKLNSKALPTEAVS